MFFVSNKKHKLLTLKWNYTKRILLLDFFVSFFHLNFFTIFFLLNFWNFIGHVLVLSFNRVFYILLKKIYSMITNCLSSSQKPNWMGKGNWINISLKSRLRIFSPRSKVPVEKNSKWCLVKEISSLLMLRLFNFFKRGENNSSFLLN